MTATILCYHKVGTEAEEGRRLNIEPARLESHVRFFARRHRPFVLARDLSGAWPKGLVCFTFDDAYSSTMMNAPDVLEKHGARASFYAVGGKVGETSDWDGEAARPLADWPLLRSVALRGHEIGNHSWSHPHLDRLDEKAQMKEVARADAALRAHGIDPGSFCFPYGCFNGDSTRALVLTGYRVGLALRKRLATKEEDNLALSRVVVAFSDTVPMLLYKLNIRARFRR